MVNKHFLYFITLLTSLYYFLPESNAEELRSVSPHLVVSKHDDSSIVDVSVRLHRCEGYSGTIFTGDRAKYRRDLCAVMKVTNNSESEQLCFSTISNNALVHAPPNELLVKINDVLINPVTPVAHHNYLKYEDYYSAKENEDWNKMRVLAPKGESFEQNIMLNQQGWYEFEEGDKLSVAVKIDTYICSTISLDGSKMLTISTLSESAKIVIDWKR
jgi:hypothetical protein